MARLSSVHATISVLMLAGVFAAVDCGGDDAAPPVTTGGSGTGGTSGGSAGTAGSTAGGGGGAGPDASATGGAGTSAGKGGMAGTTTGGKGGGGMGGGAGTGGAGTSGAGGTKADGSAGAPTDSGPGGDATRPPCMSDMNCAPPMPYCDTAARVCVQCLADGNCGGATPFCHPTAKTCVECVSSAQCSGAQPYCNTATSQCVQCLGAANCGDGSTCNLNTNTCTPACTTDMQCTSMAAPYCNVMLGYCVRCLMSTQCPMNLPACTANFTCVACIDDTTCTTGGPTGLNTHCNPLTNTCARCTANEHCGDAGLICNGTTVRTCGCTAGLNLCTIGGGRGGGMQDGGPTTLCANLQTDPAHCGMCNNACTATETCTAGNCIPMDAGGGG